MCKQTNLNDLHFYALFRNFAEWKKSTSVRKSRTYLIRKVFLLLSLLDESISLVKICIRFFPEKQSIRAYYSPYLVFWNAIFSDSTAKATTFFKKKFRSYVKKIKSSKITQPCFVSRKGNKRFNSILFLSFAS